MKHKFIGKKLKVNKDYDRICQVMSFQPTSCARLAGKYEVNIPFVGRMLIQEPQLLNFFDVIDDEPVKEAPIIKKTPNNSEKIKEALKKKRAELKSEKKDSLLKIIEDLDLEDEIASSLKKDLLVEEILKESFGEDYQAEG